MANENAPQNTPPAAPAGTPPAPAPATPPAGEPPATPAPQPPAAPVPPQAALPGVPPAAPRTKRKGPKISELVASGVEVAQRKMLKELGVSSLEELRAKLSGQAPAAGTPPAPAAPDPALERALETERKKSAKLGETVEELQSRLTRVRTRARDQRVQAQVEAAAVRAGVGDDHLEFAVGRFKKAFAALGDKGTEMSPEAAREWTNTFFRELRKTQPYIFVEPAAAPPQAVVPPTTAPPESRAPGGETPRPGNPPAPATNADEMTPEQFQSHRRRVHGFVPTY